MERLDPSKDGASNDLVTENIAKIKELFPEIVSEDRIDCEVLKELAGEYVEDRQERYSFTWNGKSQARRIAQTPSTGTLRPCPDESMNWDTTKNIFIEGDNLEVLKLLQKSYHKKVKMIYIDPPYNTGRDFIYKDDYRDNLKNYLQLTGQTDEAGRKMSANQETSGRYHTDWLNMMYPRLKLARNLLRDDGVIFISIDDVEVGNLRRLCDEIFGEENFIACIVWQRSKKGDAKRIAVIHEYILVYVRNFEESLSTGNWRIPKPGVREVLAHYKQLRNVHGLDHAKIRDEMMTWYKGMKKDDPRKSHKHYNWSDDRGLYFAADFAGPDDGRKNRPRHDIIHPVTGIPCKLPSTGWRWDQEKTNWALTQIPPRIHFGPDHTTIPNRKTYLEEIDTEPFSSVFYTDGRSATMEVENLVGEGVFSFPKNKEVLMQLLALVSSGEDIVMDFFAGSCSFAHAVIEQNRLDNSSRRYCVVQLPEPTPLESKAKSAGYSTIAEIGRERIRKAASTIAADEPSYAGDLGFKAYGLDSSNIIPWDADKESIEKALFDRVENIKPERSEDDVLYELLLKYGLDLAVPIEKREIQGKAVSITGAGALVVCLDSEITLDVVQGIAALKAELQPEVMRVVFRDSGFKDDVVKTNTVQILRQAGIEDVKSL